MAHADAAMQLIQGYDLFPALAIVCSLLVDASQNKMVHPIDREAVDQGIGLLVKRLAVVWSLALSEE